MPNKPPHKNNIRDKKKMQVSQLYLMGFPPGKIAEQCEISRATLYRLIEELEKEWDQYWMPAIEAVRTKKIAELNHLKSQVYTSLMVAQKQQDYLLVKQLGDLILKIIHTENKIFRLYNEGYGRNNVNLEELLAQYETSKKNMSYRYYSSDGSNLQELLNTESDDDDDDYDELANEIDED